MRTVFVLAEQSLRAGAAGTAVRPSRYSLVWSSFCCSVVCLVVRLLVVLRFLRRLPSSRSNPTDRAKRLTAGEARHSSEAALVAGGQKKVWKELPPAPLRVSAISPVGRVALELVPPR